MKTTVIAASLLLISNLATASVIDSKIEGYIKDTCNDNELCHSKLKAFSAAITSVHLKASANPYRQGILKSVDQKMEMSCQELYDSTQPDMINEQSNSLNTSLIIARTLKCENQ